MGYRSADASIRDRVDIKATCVTGSRHMATQERNSRMRPGLGRKPRLRRLEVAEDLGHLA